MKKQLMQNRRNRPLVKRVSAPARRSRVLWPTVAGVGMLVWLTGSQFIWVTDHQAQSPTLKIEQKAEQPKPSQAPFPMLDTTRMTSLQRTMLSTMKTEYQKMPRAYDSNVLTYTEGVRESWCADFVSWVRFRAGKPLKNRETGYWRIPGVVSLKDYYTASDAYHAADQYTPKFGDVAFYFGETPDGESREHVAFVLDVRGDTLVTLGGNETDEGVLQVRYDSRKTGVKGLAGFGESSL